jgi:subtilisin family serine protease
VKRIIVAALCSFILLEPLSSDGAPPPTGVTRPPRQTRGEGQTPQTAPIVPGEVLVKFKEAADADEIAVSGTSSRRPGLASLLSRFGVRGSRRLSTRLKERRLDHLLKLTAREGTTVVETLELAATLRKRPEVEYAEPNRVMEAVFVPNDPYFLSSGAWGQPFRDLWGLEKLEAGAAWDRTRGAGVVVAVLDTGIDATHPDLAGQLWQNPGEMGFGRETNGWDDDGNGFVDDVNGWNFVWNYRVTNDDHGHGTHVGGTIAAAGNNATGISGVAPLSKLMAVKVLDAGGSGTVEAIANGILYAANNGARIINLSLGGFGDTPQTLVDAIAYAHDVKGVVRREPGSFHPFVEGG